MKFSPLIVELLKFILMSSCHFFELHSWWGVLDTTCDKVCQRLVTGRWFSSGTLVSSINKTDHYLQFVRHFGFSARSAHFPNAKVNPPRKGDADFMIRSRKLNCAADMLQDSLMLVIKVFQMSLISPREISGLKSNLHW
jgi:hypothetical protein